MDTSYGATRREGSLGLDGQGPTEVRSHLARVAVQ